MKRQLFFLFSFICSICYGFHRNDYKPFDGVVAAVHTLFHSHDLSLNTDSIAPQLNHLLQNNVIGAFVAGTTGEGYVLQPYERKELLQSWINARREAIADNTAHSKNFRIIAHVGYNFPYDYENNSEFSQDDFIEISKDLASHAQDLNIDGIAMSASSIFGPINENKLVRMLKAVAECAPSLPFYYYHIPDMTGVHVNMMSLTNMLINKIPNFVGIKYSSNDFDNLRTLLDFEEIEVLFGKDEHLVDALRCYDEHDKNFFAFIGSSYNYAGHIANTIIDSYRSHDYDQAITAQKDLNSLIDELRTYNYNAAAKRVLGKLINFDPTSRAFNDVKNFSMDQFIDRLTNTI